LEKVPVAPPRRARRNPHPHAAIGTSILGTITCSNNAVTNVKIDVSTTPASGEISLAELDVANLSPRCDAVQIVR
jgi:hypothetical protein